MIFIFFFFFSSRRRHTRSTRDWSSDVCSSDLLSAGVRLDVDVLGPRKEGDGTVLGQAFRDVDEFAAAVIALARQALGVLVRQPRALGLHDRAERVVLRRDQLDLVVLAVALALHRGPQVGIDIRDASPAEAGWAG